MEEWSESIVLHDEDLFLAFVYIFPWHFYFQFKQPTSDRKLSVHSKSLTEFNFNKVSDQKPATLLKIEFLRRHFSIAFSADVEQFFGRKPPSAYFFH